MLFDPYGEWLGIPPDRRPPSYYDLLGLTLGQHSCDQIRRAAEERYRRVHAYTLGPERDRAAQLLVEIAEAVDCLTDPAKKERYDGEQVGAPPPEGLPAVAPATVPGDTAQSPQQAPDVATAPEERVPLLRTGADKPAVTSRWFPVVRGGILRAARRTDDALLAMAGEGNKILHGFLRVAAAAVAVAVLAAFSLIIPVVFRGYTRPEQAAAPSVVAPAEDNGSRTEASTAPKAEPTQVPAPLAEPPAARAKHEPPSEGPQTTPPVNKPTPKKRAKKATIPAGQKLAAKGPGLLAEIYADPGLRKKVTERVDSQVNFLWGTDGPHPQAPKERFSIRWTGWIKAPIPGRYRLVIHVDNGARLWLDGRLLIDKWPPAVASYSADADLSDQPHAIKIEYHDTGVAAAMVLNWISPANMLEQAVPAEVLFQDRLSAERASISPAILSSRPTARMAKFRLNQPIDLMPYVRPSQFTVAGRWWFQGTSLVGGFGSPALLQLPLVPPREYEIVATIERLAGPECFVLGLLGGGRQFCASLDAYPWAGGYSGVTLDDGKDVNDNPQARKGMWFSRGRPVTVRYVVREGHVAVICDGRMVIDRQIDYAKCTVPRDWKVPETRELFLGVFATAFRITKMELTPLSIQFQFPRELPQEQTLERFYVPGMHPGVLLVQDMSQWGSHQWLNGDQLQWHSAQPGDRLEMSMPVGRKGNYRLVAKLTRAPDYAIVQLSLDGKKLGGPIDLYGPSVEPVPPIVLGARGLAEGQHQLAVEIVGVNPNAAKAHIFGLDYLRLQRLR